MDIQLKESMLIFQISSFMEDMQTKSLYIRNMQRHKKDTLICLNRLQWPRIRPSFSHMYLFSLLFRFFILLFLIYQVRLQRSELPKQKFSKWISKIITNLCEHLLEFVTSYLFKGEIKGDPYWGKWNRWI